MDFRRAVDNTDWLKTVAIILVTVDHVGFFFMEDDSWWSAFGRLAAPVFFFLMGYAKTRHVPLHWLWLAIILTLLESWNEDWSWVTPNIFFSFILIRLARPHALILVKNQGWLAFFFLAFALMAVQPIAAIMVDYGAEGWLWALFGLCQRLYLDDRSNVKTDSTRPKEALSAHGPPVYGGAMRLFACFLAAAFYIWQEQVEYAFPYIHLGVVILGIGLLCFSLCFFARGRSPVQPPGPAAALIRFMGRYTLEIYAVQLAGSELLVKLLPDLAP